MRGVFDDELEMPRTQRDAELTLGNGTLLLLFFGLVLVCGLCFGLGYSVGHRSALTGAANQQPTADAATNLSTGGGAGKPSATTQAAVQQPAQSSTPPSDEAQAANAATAPAAVPAPANLVAAQPASPPQVRPALPAVQTSSPAASSARPQQQASTQLTVQIAAVSHQEDADVLVGALRKRGYEVNARREGDGLIHVRIGPFKTRDEAGRWRMKLLNDGYNAIVQP